MSRHEKPIVRRLAWRFAWSIFLLQLCLCTAYAQAAKSTSKPAIQRFAISNAKGESLSGYLRISGTGKTNDKLLVMIQGSGIESVTQTSSYWVGATIAKSGWDVLHIQKYAYNNRPIFAKTNSRERRVQDIEFVTNYIIDKIYKHNLKELCIAGGSEGGAIAPEVACRIKGVTRLIVFCAGGYTQSKAFELLLQKELKENKKGFFRSYGIESLDAMRAKFDDIRAHPASEQLWLGYPYIYWNSYLWYMPKDYLEQLSIPTLYIVGEEDRNGPPEFVENLKADLPNKTNIEYKLLPGLDHSFSDAHGKNRLPQILKEIVIPWLSGGTGSSSG